MPRRTHYARLQRVEWRSGTCACQSARALVCLKQIQAHERGELVTEPCPAGCAPGKRLVVVIRMSAWRNGEECTCPGCDPLRQKRPAVPETVAKPPLALAPPSGGRDVHPDAARAPAGSYGSDGGPREPVPDGPARNAVVELRRSHELLPAAPQLLGEAEWRAQRSAEYARLAALLAEKDRIIAANAERIARLQADIDRLQAAAEVARRSRREQEHNTPSGGPVHVPGPFGQG